VNERVQAELNRQINMELHAYYTYLSMSAYFEDYGLSGFAQWMYHHAEEEMTHAMKIYGYIHTRRGRVTLDEIHQPRHEWESPLDAFEDAMKHEEAVTASINKIVGIAREEGDYATDSFLQWFVDEQVEEEEVVDTNLQKLKLIGDFKPGLYLLDRELMEDGGHGDEDEGE